MNATNDETTSLIQRIAERLVAHRADLRLARQEGDDGAVYWSLQANEADDPRLVGKHGTHVDALRFLVTMFGRAERLAFTFRLFTKDGRNEREAAAVIAKTYDPTPAQNLLIDILSGLDIGEFRVEATPGPGRRNVLSYQFKILLANPTDHGALTVPRRFKHRLGDEMSVEAALGTIFRAVAMADGVRIKISVEEPT